MKSDQHNRRNFLAGIGSAATAGFFMNTMLPFSATHAQKKSPYPGDLGTEYLFEDGLTYLNTGTLGPCRREIVEESMKMWQELESVPVKFYGKFGAESYAENTRAAAAGFLGCDVDEIMITGSTTSGMNAIAQGLRLQAGDHILTTDQEHGGGLLCWEYLARYYGVIIDKIKIPPGENNGDLILTRVKQHLTKNTKLISISHIFSSTGLRVPVAEISALARANGSLCIVDGAQAAGAIKVDVRQLGCHAYSTSGHKWLMGPKGTGILYISKEAQDKIRPMQFEESHNTYTNGNGVMNLACIVGLGKAIEYLESIGIGKIEEHNLKLRNQLYNKLKDLDNVRILSPAEGLLASPMLTLLLPKRVEKTAFVKMLFDKYKLSIRATHKEFGFNGIRFSVHIFNNEKHVELASEIMHKEFT